MICSASWRTRACAFVLTSLAFAIPARAVIVLGGRTSGGTLNSSGQNSNPAPSSLSSYVGTWGDFLGTPISPQYFVTANHIGNGGGINAGVFTYSDGGVTSVNYSATLAGTQDDLAIWKISSPAFTHYSPLYTGSSEVGLSMISIGRGTPRGSVVNTPSTANPAGWNWGVADPSHPATWGANTVAQVITPPNPSPGLGGDFLVWNFDNNADPDTGILSNGDSGGPTFVFNTVSNQYELAGINTAVDQVSTQSDSNGNFVLAASLFDARGFYDGTTQITGTDPVPLSSYSTRISSRLDVIESMTGVPEPGIGATILTAVTLCIRRRRPGR